MSLALRMFAQTTDLGASIVTVWRNSWKVSSGGGTSSGSNRRGRIAKASKDGLAVCLKRQATDMQTPPRIASA